MTLTKYWVRQGYWVDDEFLEPGNPAHRECFYLTSDVDKVVEELQKEREKVVKLVNEHLSTKRNPDDLEDAVRQILQVMVSEKGNADKLQADLARVTAELEKAKRIMKAILYTDERGQGIDYSESMNAAK